MIVKICGVGHVDDAVHALGGGADWIGLNLVAGPRRISLERATQIVSVVPPAACVALVRVGPQDGGDPASGPAADTAQAETAPTDLSAIQRLGIRRVQPYGDVTANSLDSLVELGFETIYVHAVADLRSLENLRSFLASCTTSPDFVLLDAHSRTSLGGTGRHANWEAIERARREGWTADWPPIILAGGLTPDSVGTAVRRLEPAGVDVSSGVEREPGIKDHAAVGSFIAAARSARS